MLCVCATRCAATQVEALIKEFDANGDGELQFEEFAAMWAADMAGMEDADGGVKATERDDSGSDPSVANVSDPAVPAAAPESAQPAVKRRPLELIIGAALVKKQLKIAELGGKWDEKKKGSLSKAELGKQLHNLGVVPHAGELEKLFEVLLSGQGAAAHVVNGVNELDVKRLVKTVFEYASKASEEHKNATAKLNSLKAAAKKLQAAINTMEDSSFVRQKTIAEQAEAAVEAEARKKEEEKAAKEAAKAEAAAKKAEEKLAFDAKIEAKRAAAAAEAAARRGEGEPMW